MFISLLNTHHVSRFTRFHMPLISIQKELERAQRGGYAVPLFDAFDSHSIDGMFQAIDKKRAPAIVALYAHLVEQPNARALAAYIQTRAENTDLPVSLMLDHGSSVEQCLKAIEYGFTDVMYDGSTLPLEENIVNTQAVVKAAHTQGICVEAELGHVGHGSQYQEFGAQRKGFTEPDAVNMFLAETGVDFLAVAIGTAHGVYNGEPQIDLELLRQIRSQVEIPLVMHGGSGCSQDQFRAVIAAGIAKINVATDLFLTTGRRLIEAVKMPDASYFSLGKTAIESFRERCEYYLDLFGTSGKA